MNAKRGRWKQGLLGITPASAKIREPETRFNSSNDINNSLYKIYEIKTF